MPEASSASWAESGALVAAWLVLLSLTLWPQALSALPPTAALLVVMRALWLAPGFALWRLCSGPGAPALHALFHAIGLGLTWLVIPCALAMLAGAHIETLLRMLVALNGVLAAGFIVRRLSGRPIGLGPEETPPRWPRPTWWAVLAAALVVARLLPLVTWRVNRFTYGGDEWLLMRAVRAFLDRPTVADPLEFDVWDLVVALLVRLSGLEVLDVYRIHLPPLLMLAAAAAFLALADEVLQDRNLSFIGLALLGLYALSDMHTRGEGMGMALAVRIVEDKYTALMIALPLAQATFWRWLRTRSGRVLAAFAALSVAASLIQPFAVPWLAFTCGATFVAGTLSGLLPRRRGLWAGLGLLLGLGVVVAWTLRGLRPGPYFALYDPGWGFNATLRELSFRQLLILSLEKGWYMGHPWLLVHPLLIASLAASLLLIRQARRSLAAQWMLIATWLPLALVFNPLTAVALGRLVTPWRLYRLLWVMPVALVLAWVLQRGLVRLEVRLAGRWPRLGGRRLAVGPLAAVGILLCAVALRPLIAESGLAFRLRNRIAVRPPEKEFMRTVASMARERELHGIVLTTEELSIRLPAWTARLVPAPGIEAVRFGQRDLLKACAAFHRARSLPPEAVALLRARDVRYFIVETGSPVSAALERQPSLFSRLHAEGELAFYELRPLAP